VKKRRRGCVADIRNLRSSRSQKFDSNEHTATEKRPHRENRSKNMLKLKQLQQQKQAAQQAKAVEQEAAAAATNGGGDAAASTSTEPATTNGEAKSTSHAAASLMAKYKATSAGKKEEGVMSLSKTGGRNKKRQNAVELRVQKGACIPPPFSRDVHLPSNLA
jgi:hypothetical protein